MTSDIEIRNETNDDIASIAEVRIAAFRDLEINNQTEHLIIEALALSRVAVVDGRVVGDIALSPVTLSDGTPLRRDDAAGHCRVPRGMRSGWPVVARERDVTGQARYARQRFKPTRRLDTGTAASGSAEPQA